MNKVRKRARETNPLDPRKDMQAYVPATTSSTLPDITTTNKDELREIIWHERRVELAMEGWRRDDLMRQHRFGEQCVLMPISIMCRRVAILTMSVITSCQFLKVSVIRVTIFLHRIQNTKKVDINNRYIKG